MLFHMFACIFYLVTVICFFVSLCERGNKVAHLWERIIAFVSVITKFIINIACYMLQRFFFYYSYLELPILYCTDLEATFSTKREHVSSSSVPKTKHFISPVILCSYQHRYKIGELLHRRLYTFDVFLQEYFIFIYCTQ